jgi:hypothetical protein
MEALVQGAGKKNKQDLVASFGPSSSCCASRRIGWCATSARLPEARAKVPPFNAIEFERQVGSNDYNGYTDRDGNDSALAEKPAASAKLLGSLKCRRSETQARRFGHKSFGGRRSWCALLSWPKSNLFCRRTPLRSISATTRGADSPGRTRLSATSRPRRFASRRSPKSRASAPARASRASARARSTHAPARHRSSSRTHQARRFQHARSTCR